MKKKQRWKKFCQILTISSTILALIVIIDIARSGSIYQPLVHTYKALSYFQCFTSKAPSCSNQKLSSSPVSSSKGMVVTSQHLASRVGAQILQQGGNAVDAAVAVGYALAVTDPCCGNIGGGGFMLIHLKNGQDIFINFREKASQKATTTMYLDAKGKVIPQLSTSGYLAVAIPGTVAGLDMALTQYGTMTRAKVMAPAIQLAEEGFILQQGDVDILNQGSKKFKAQPNIAAIFLKKGRDPYKVGDRLVQKNLAATLKLISHKGAEAFYQGAIADQIVQASREQGGILTLQDFANYKVSQTEPTRCNYRGYEVISAPPPGGGTTLCQMLNILEGYPLQKLGWHTSASLHKMLAAMLRAYADRNTYLGDPEFVKNPVERLLSKGYAAQLRATILENRATSPQQFYAGITDNKEGHNTTHYSIIDQYGNAVAVTYTINIYFGAGVIAGNTGFFLNNEMDDFTSKPGVPNTFGLVQGKANAIAPGKRPLSSMSPTIVTKNNSLFLVTGSPGGSTIPTTVLQTITNAIDYDMNIEQAVNSPRIHYQGLPDWVATEANALDTTTVKNLWNMGYKVVPLFNWGTAESIFVNPKTQLIYGASDRRKLAGKAVSPQ